MRRLFELAAVLGALVAVLVIPAMLMACPVVPTGSFSIRQGYAQAYVQPQAFAQSYTQAYVQPQAYTQAVVQPDCGCNQAYTQAYTQSVVAPVCTQAVYAQPIVTQPVYAQSIISQPIYSAVSSCNTSAIVFRDRIGYRPPRRAVVLPRGGGVHVRVGL